MKSTIDGAGRLVIPKPMRERLGLEPGDEVEVQLALDGVLISPVDLGAAVIELEQGFPVVRTGGEALTTETLLGLRDAERR